MASLLVQIYVSNDGNDYRILDTFKDEAVEIKATLKDSKDPSKIHAPYSLTFKLPATSRNKIAFGFLGNSKVQRNFSSLKLKCKIYVGGSLSKVGVLKVTGIDYKGQEIQQYSANFATALTSLKDILGDSLISDLDNYDVVNNPFPWIFKWSPLNVSAVLNSTTGILSPDVDQVKVPMYSNKRVWNYEEPEESILLDNIHYRTTTTPSSKNMIKIDELRPAIKMTNILNRLINKFGFSVNMPLKSREELNKLFVWCTAETMPITASNLTIQNIYGATAKYTYPNTIGSPNIPSVMRYRSTRVSSDTVNIAYQSSGVTTYLSTQAFHEVTIYNITSSNTDNINSNLECTFTYLNKDTGEVLYRVTKGLESLRTPTGSVLTGKGFRSALLLTPEMFLTVSNINIITKVEFNYSVVWQATNFILKSYYYKNIFESGYLYSASFNNNNYQSSNVGLMPLFKCLPKVKCIEFLQSLIYMYNIRILDNDSSEDDLDFVTPLDIAPNSTSLFSSVNKREVDYTRYLDTSTSNKTPVALDYNGYDFKHASSKYFSNVKFKELDPEGLEFGQAKFKVPDEKDIKEYKVETKFSIIPPIQIPNTRIHTCYGFGAETPTYLDTGEARYSPIWDELTIFYYYDYIPSSSVLGTQRIAVQSQVPSTGAFTVSPLNYITRFLPFLKSTSQSLMFSTYNDNTLIYVNNNINDTQLSNNLYINYYDKQVSRSLDPNVFKEVVTLNLPSPELSLRVDPLATSSNTPPIGFRLQNDIILGETRYSVEDVSIDITTGKSKLTLLNYT